MTALHLNLDNAWLPARLPCPTLDALSAGPLLRYIAPEKILRRSLQPLTAQIPPETRLLLYGSGDFHYLAAWWLQRALQLHPAAKNVHLLSFDNHPDWDIRPPRWACGGWINRALEFPELSDASVWGCGNFELTFPSRLFRNRRALRTGRLAIHPWAERFSPDVAARFNAMTRANWRDRFSTFLSQLANRPTYITLDLDALSPDHVTTNWENGLFTPDDITWALQQLHQKTEILGLDLCGAYSPQSYARPFQRFAARFDHPKLPPIDPAAARDKNHATLAALWPLLSTL